ncbi:hypothetical protein NBH00_05180 [Paraconexibacter antarcticus]|uniref:Uncharacterized protein n=1 Tax=Paraconexibacter antarcticus TaxID=2949664 RepID=A0ABY5DUA3_9ACTN|nr:hypothetical protein [Paraconexibacter antarcticus]UTI65603.1 hypothetical protein NBH00_05180 [Paraconexibacter antarcticus]
MTLSTQPLPTLGASNSTEDPKVRSLLSELQNILNGGLDGTNLTGGNLNVSSGLGVTSAGQLTLASGASNDTMLFLGSGAVERARFSSAGLAIANGFQMGWADAYFTRPSTGVISTSQILQAPTATVGTNTTQVATTAFVLANSGAATFPQATLTNRTAVNTETVMAQFSLAANNLTVGKAYEIRFVYFVSTATTNAERQFLRIGTAGTTADAVVAQLPATMDNISTSNAIVFTVTFTCLSTGTTGTVTAGGHTIHATGTGSPTTPGVYVTQSSPTTATVNTTATLFVSVTASNTASSGATARQATMHQVA